ncbi:MAG: M60 family metallopeptidase [Clostridia bacterium]|nr:M60 family metallopeptidase [Clostridia bacterium]
MKTGKNVKSNSAAEAAVNPPPAKKLSKPAIVLIAAAVVIVLTLCIVLPIVLRSKPDLVFKPPATTLPTEELYALQQYDYDSLGDTQVTIRSDVMNVTKRNLPRAQTEMLSDDFSLVYDTDAKQLRAEYALVNSTENLKTASITFNKDAYPYPSMKNSSVEFYQNAYANAANAAGVTPAQYFNYYKYMLMTQGQHLAIEAARRSALSRRDIGDTAPRSAENSLTGWLKKHPAADLQYGAVLGTDNAVEKEIILDPIYRAQHATGLYLPAGEVVTVKIEGLAKGEKVSIIIGRQDSLAWRGSIPSGAEADIAAVTGGINTVSFADSASDLFFKKADIVTATGKFFDYNTNSTPFLQSQWARQNSRAPWMMAEFTFTQDGEYEIGTAMGGVMHLDPKNCYSAIKTTISGAVETPHYILGSTTPEYFDKYLRNAPGVVGVLDTENGQLIGPTGTMGTSTYMRGVKTEEIDKLAMLWHSFFTVNESFTGGVYNRYNRVMFDHHVPAGAAVALGGYSYACPTSWFGNAMNYRGLLASGAWGILHEVGHNHSTSYGTVWGFAGNMESEVRNNALNLLSYIMMCDVGTTIRMGGTAEHGAYANPYSSLTLSIALRGKKTDFNQNGYFEALSMYANIMHSFGAEKFYELLYTYKATSSYAANKRADFSYRCSLIMGMNFNKYFNDLYAANITDDMFDEEQLAYIKSLPNYEPISCYYAGGIDGVKTAGDYLVAYGSDIEFDLLGNTISSLDTENAKGFEIIAVGKPEHGKIREIGGGKWAYSFNKKYTGVFDEFTFDVKLADGIVHRFTITLRISYNGARVSTYKVSNPSANGAAMVDALEGQIANLTPTYSNSTFAGVPAFTSSDWEVRVADFWWRAPKSGDVTLGVSGSNGLCLYFGENFESLERTSLIYTAGASYNHGYTVNVVEGNYYAVRVLNTNRGGRGGATVGIMGEDGKYSAIAASQIYHTDYPLGQEAETYIFEPNYLVSKKDNVKLNLSGTDKSEWTVIKAPENIVDGRTHVEVITDLETGLPYDKIETDKWTWLIDGQVGTLLHTTYNRSDPQITANNPHEFIIDTSRSQSFNYFTVTTRNNSNSYIIGYELQISDTADGDWKTVASGDKLEYKGTVATLNFDTVQGRYFRLLVKSTTGGNFSVIAELDAGIVSQTQRVIPSTSSKLYTTKGWRASMSLADEPNGCIVTEHKNEKLVFRFVGDTVSVYATTGEGYGSAKVKVDGKDVGTIDLDEKNGTLRKLVFHMDNLENKEHTVELITQSSDKVMLNCLGIAYTADLLNAPNIYLEKNLTIALVVFIALFVLLLAVILLIVFLPRFRKAVLDSKALNSLDEHNASRKAKRAEKKKEKAVAATVSETKEDTAAKKSAKSESSDKTSVAKPAESKAAAKSVDVKEEAKPAKAEKAEKAQTKAEAKSEAKPAAKAAAKTDAKQTKQTAAKTEKKSDAKAAPKSSKTASADKAKKSTDSKAKK